LEATISEIISGKVQVKAAMDEAAARSRKLLRA
jgi:hypothetical protein